MAIIFDIVDCSVKHREGYYAAPADAFLDERVDVRNCVPVAECWEAFGTYDVVQFLLCPRLHTRVHDHSKKKHQDGSHTLVVEWT